MIWSLFILLVDELFRKGEKERERERERAFCFVGIWTQAKVPTTSGVINCMAKKKGHLSATPYLDQHYKRDIHMCAHFLILTQILHTELTSHRATLNWLEEAVTLNCQFFHLEHVLSCQSANEVCVINLTVYVCQCAWACVYLCEFCVWKLVRLFGELVRSCDKQEKRSAKNWVAFGGGLLIT